MLHLHTGIQCTDVPLCALRSRSRPDRDRGADARPHREGGGANSDASSEDCKKHKDDAHPSPAGRAGKGSRTARRSGHKKDAEHAASYTHTQVTATVTLRTERVEHSECSEHCEHTHQTEQGESAGHAEFGQDDGLANAHDQPAADAESPEENDGEGGPRTTVVTALVHREDGPAGPEVRRLPGHGPSPARQRKYPACRALTSLEYLLRGVTFSREVRRAQGVNFGTAPQLWWCCCFIFNTM